jgi:hypothetical protein
MASNMLIMLVLLFRERVDPLSTQYSCKYLYKWQLLAKMVGFEPLPRIENKELNGFSVPHDPLDPHKCPGRDTY